MLAMQGQSLAGADAMSAVDFVTPSALCPALCFCGKTNDAGRTAVIAQVAHQTTRAPLIPRKSIHNIFTSNLAHLLNDGGGGVHDAVVLAALACLDGEPPAHHVQRVGGTHAHDAGARANA